MQIGAVALWGAFFGTAALMLAGAVAAFARSLHRVAVTAALSAIVSASFVVAYLGLLPVEDAQANERLLAHIAVLSSTVLALMLLAMLGLLRDPRRARRVRSGMASGAVAVLAVGWLLAPRGALVLGSVVACGLGAVMLGICMRCARRGDRLAWAAVSGVSFMLVSLAGLSWIAFRHGDVALYVHAASAISGMAYLATMAAALWLRYSWLIELRQVVTQGPRYDPVTRMRTHADTGEMVGMAFFRRSQETRRPLGVISVSIANLETIESLHGRAAMNHALFVCASRLRRCLPSGVDIGRLGDDGFLLLVRDTDEPGHFERLAHLVAERLSRPVSLSTGTAPPDLESGQAHWVAQVGVGLHLAQPDGHPSHAIIAARRMSRAAWSYASRVACHDARTGHITEVRAAAA